MPELVSAAERMAKTFFPGGDGMIYGTILAFLYGMIRGKKQVGVR